MASTNKTTNYSLPQWEGTDHPSFSADFNPAFLAIDTQMKANADSASNLDTRVTQNESDIAALKTDSIFNYNVVALTCDNFDNASSMILLPETAES